MGPLVPLNRVDGFAVLVFQRMTVWSSEPEYMA
jgi:hypothetical protein